MAQAILPKIISKLPCSEAVSIHDEYANAEAFIAENLSPFDQFDFASLWLAVLPLKLIGYDGSPTQGVAITVTRTKQRSPVAHWVGKCLIF